MYSHAELPPRALRVSTPVARAAFAQVMACGAMLGADPAQPYWFAGQALLASAVGSLLGLPRWWIPINLAFLPCVVVASAWGIPAHIYLAAFAALAGVYGMATRTRAPLYFSSISACRVLSTLLPANRPFRFLDAGCGIGTTLAWLSPRHLSGSFKGVEWAPLPAGVAWLRSCLSGGLFRVHRADLWSLRLSDYDVVYAFLSPVPMNALLSKARQEMRKGTLLVSNTFLPDGPPPDVSIPLPGRGRALHAWRF